MKINQKKEKRLGSTRVKLERARSALALAVSLAVTAAIATSGTMQPANAGDRVTLREAMAAARETNPTLSAGRHRTTAAATEVDIARSGYRPNIYGEASFGLDENRSSDARNGFDRRRTYALRLEQNVFDGFQTYNAVRSSKARSSVPTLTLGSP